ncbi:hypothetical protein H5T89_10550 [bacterium]|nr:hypothetical protein [bacterium]
MTFNYTSDNQDISFANIKANQIIEELKSYIRKGEEKRAEYLDNFDDGTSYNPVLTTVKNATPDHILSGNSKLSDGSWKYYRRITVKKLPNVESRDVRYVIVEMFKKVGNGYKKLTDLSTIISTMGTPDIPQQVYDIYLIAIENVPGWWVNTTNLRMMVDSAISEMESRNPNLTIRAHWITRLSYGRDEYYRPYINKENTVAQSIPWAYLYPGLLNNDNKANSYYYDANFIRGKLNIDGVNNEGRYALADQFNHSMRYPDEVLRYNYEKQFDPNLEPSWRMLMEDLFSNPDKYKNSIIINLHGELMPFPPLRNYSDPAKDPENYPGVRVVTHPEKLRYNTGDNVNLRVYAYLMPEYSSPDSVNYITILLRGISLDTNNDGIIEGISRVRFIEGDDDNNPTRYNASVLYDNDGSLIGTKILLKNTPTKCPYHSGSKTGLDSSKRLYGLEYIPCPVGTSSDYSAWQDLTTPGNTPKNTARWIITLDGTVLNSIYPSNKMLTIETYIGNKGPNDIPDPIQYTPNRSRTYTWIGLDPPITEKFQFMGDPRYCLYLDVKSNGWYNRWFTSNLSGYYGFTGCNNGWGMPYYSNYPFDSDIPRYFQIFRDGILRSSSIFNSVTGFSFYYVGFGQEMGGDTANPYINNLLDNPISRLPWGGLSRTAKVDEIIPDDGANYSYCRLIKDKNSSWYSRVWLGELYPDSQYNNWKTYGNLPAPTFYRERYSSLGYPYDRFKRAREYGPPTALNGSSDPTNSNLGFNHEHRNPPNATNTTTLTDDGRRMNTAFNIVLPEKMDARRPFALNVNLSSKGWRPPQWNEPSFSNYRGTLSFYKSYYNASFNSSYRSSALLKLTAPTLAGDTKTGYFLINGLSPAGEAGVAFISRYALVSTIMGFLDAGNPSNPDRIEQVPYVTITAPTETDEINNPESITIEWSLEWKRWDGKPYSDYTYTNPPQVIYAVKYSTDGGKTWKYIQDDQSTSPGERPDDTHKLESTSYIVNTPANKFPIGTYMFMVEAYRRDIPNHYAFHQRRIFIRR